MATMKFVDLNNLKANLEAFNEKVVQPQIIKVSEETDNAITTKDDGIFVEKMSVEISEETGNALSKKDDGLFVEKTTIAISEEEGNIITTKDDGSLFAKVDVEAETDTINWD